MKLKMVEDPLNADLIHTLAHIKELVYRISEVETKDLYLNRSAAELLYMIDHTNMNQKEIAKVLCITEATLSVRIKRLEKQGYLIKEPDEKDHRRYHLYLTNKANDELEESIKRINSIHEVMLKGITKEDFEHILRIYKKIEGNLEEKVKEGL
jgi:DNA-binding MarR family transcriptional regulator